MIGDDKPELLRIELIGKDPKLFDALFEKLQETIIDVVEKLSGREVNPSMQTALDEVMGAAQIFLEAKLKEPSIKNKKLLADITKTYAEAEEALARARRENAAAEQIELDNLRRKIETAIWVMKTIDVRALTTQDGLLIDFSGSGDK